MKTENYNLIAPEKLGDGKHTAIEAVRLAVKVKGTDKVALHFMRSLLFIDS